MAIRDIAIAIQFCTIVGVFLESWIVFRNIKTKLHCYLLFSCIAILINNAGYLFEITSTSEASCLVALKLSYVGRVWLALSLFLFISELCRFRIHRLIKTSFVVFHCITYLFILSLEKHNLYYTSINYVDDGIFPRLEHENGIIHHIFMALQLFYIFFGIAWLIYSCYKEKNKTRRGSLNLVIAAFIIESVFFVIQITKALPITEYYDVTMIGYFIGTIFMIISILSFDLLGTRELAKEFMIDRISEGVIAVDNYNQIQYYNDSVESVFPEIKNDTQSVLDEISSAISNKENIEKDNRIFTPEVNELVNEGRKYGKLYVLVDSTEHYKYMEELERQKEIADKENMSKSMFLATMSHEIRTPINAVLGMDEMILREAKDNAIKSYAADIKSAGNTLLSIINDILDLSKAESGNIEIIPVKYELSSMINDLVNMINGRAKSKELAFNVNVDENIPYMLYGDEIRVKQCALNILTNAVKYTNKGSVDFFVSYEKKDEDSIMLKFEVKDTGIGMKNEDMERLFSPYKRIDAKRNREVEGTGLGISITKLLLELMDSKLDVESEYGEGSCFSFVVEQKVVSWDAIGDYSKRYIEKNEMDLKYKELFHAPNAKILVVDDTEINLSVMENLLKSTQIQIDCASSGRKALAYTQGTKYDLVFIDHMMPGMDGIETLKFMRKAGANKETPAIALTANAISGARAAYIEAGFTDYLSKPVSGLKLEQMIMIYLPGDKLILPSDPGFATSGNDSEEEISEVPKYLKDIEEINIDKGIENSGSIESYLSILDVFAKTADDKAVELVDYLANSDIANYTIKVHALKSSARIIGADDLSEAARRLEDAGKVMDLDYINKYTGKLVEDYLQLKDKLLSDKKDDNKKANLPEINPSLLKEGYSTIFEVAMEMDYPMMEEVLKDLRSYKLPANDDSIIALIEKHLTELDWNKIAELAKKGLE